MEKEGETTAARSVGWDKYSSVWIGWGGRKDGRNSALSLSPVTQIRTNTRQKVEEGREGKRRERSDLETDGVRGKANMNEVQ